MLDIVSYESYDRRRESARMIKLVVSPKDPPWSWARFSEEAPRFAIALDGFVWGGPRFEASKPCVNFNHHEEVDRLATRSTCAQSLMAIRQGLFELFRTEEGPEATVFANDCDEDVCTSWYLLSHHYLCQQTMHPLLNRLVALEDALDATAGAYPFPVDMPALREMAWIFEPYRRFRLSGEIDKRESRAFQTVIEDVTHRIEQHLVGQGKELPIDTRYDRIGGGHGWAMVREIGAQAKTGIFADGIRAYVSARERPDGRWTYVVGRMSPFIRFNLEAIFAECNRIDGDGSTDLWGGSNTIGGSPRVRGSGIDPDAMVKIVNDVARLDAPRFPTTWAPAIIGVAEP